MIFLCACVECETLEASARPNAVFAFLAAHRLCVVRLEAVYEDNDRAVLDRYAMAS